MKLSRQMPLNALRVFESVARLLSFTKAGEELGMSQTAVSYQIKLLEDKIGERLFLRQTRQIALTEAGERLAPAVKQAFDLLSEGLAAASRDSTELLTIYATTTFAHQWLTPRIGRFQIAYPNVAVRLVTGQSPADIGADNADVAIRWGTDAWPGLRAHKVLEADFTPMLNPKLAESIGGIRKPSDLLKLRLIDPGDKWWVLWFKAAGVGEVSIPHSLRNRLGAQSLEAGAAIAGYGVGILTPAFYRDEVRRGVLFQPFSVNARDGSDYYLTYPDSRRNSSKIRMFRDWILKEAADDAKLAGEAFNRTS
ncbi:LysR substrate-binding domain-containing protein [Oryzifoliimicrobium ureilyticus]|uniref:LysR substrate-binding domain-containing protein n=1 Tax=Oryzifoliimicrobium ureilyticus TaxID=3113724 RepID=UPI00307661EC